MPSGPGQFRASACPRGGVTSHIKFPGPHRYQREVQVLHEIARTLTSSLDLDHVLQAIMQQMARAFHPESWALLMMDPVLQELRFTAGSESVLGGKQELRVPVGEGIL